MPAEHARASRGVRRSHAHSDAGIRRAKAAKIARLVEGFTALEGRKVLEVGCGSGHIASFMAEQVGPEGAVWGVDVVDERESSEGFTFELVEDAHLPFDDASFDVVISNHVLEHVGDEVAQDLHVRELRRVLRPGGVCYLAVPNRWAIVEPHYGLPLLSWLPAAAADFYVRIARDGDWYDVNPPSHRQLQGLFAQARFAVHDLTLPALELMAETEPDRHMPRIANALPHAIIKAASRFAPTFVFGLELR